VRRFRVSLCPALALFEDAPDLACGLVATTCQQLQGQIDRAAHQPKPSYAGPHTSAGKTRSTPILDLSFIGSV
jgi:hypothetical protein